MPFLTSMRSALSILLFLLFSCAPDTKPYFNALAAKTDVEIILSDYKLESVPKDIGDLKAVKKLYITKDTSGWTLYPPLSALGSNTSAPPFRHLPKEITDLTSLESLTLVNLDLVTLPDNIDRLHNLDTLILFENKLTIANEINKLSRLKNLKYLGLLGNNVTADDLKQIKDAIPGVTINPELR